MKKLLKKLSRGPLSPVFKVYRKIYKPVVLHFFYPVAYKFFTLTRKVNPKKVVFIEARFDKITDTFQLIYNRMEKEGYEIHECFLLNTKPGKLAYTKRSLHMLKEISDAHYIFLNDACNVTSCISLRKGSSIFQVWHACGAFKKFGMSTADLIFGDNRKNQEPGNQLGL